jgi:hypothetical protein
MIIEFGIQIIPIIFQYHGTYDGNMGILLILGFYLRTNIALRSKSLSEAKLQFILKQMSV